jgi:hypothetical protein
MTLETPWISRTGQGWKLNIFYGLVILLVIVTLSGFVPALNDTMFGDDDTRRFVNVVIGALAFSWLVLAFRCRRCGTRIGWWHVRNSAVSSWFTAFLNTAECPYCKSRD